LVTGRLIRLAGLLMTARKITLVHPPGKTRIEDQPDYRIIIQHAFPKDLESVSIGPDQITLLAYCLGEESSSLHIFQQT
jgi:hypothetical protein